MLAPSTHTVAHPLGAVLRLLSGISLPWTTTTAFAIRDANATNFARAASTWSGFDSVSKTLQVQAFLKQYQGHPVGQHDRRG